jgi:membrane protein
MVVDAMHAARRHQGIWATIVSVVTLIIGATTVFGALESALRQVWGTRLEQPGGWRGFLRTTRHFTSGSSSPSDSCCCVVDHDHCAFRLARLGRHRYEGLVTILGVLEFVLSTALGTGLIALMYRYLPAVRLAWRQVLLGALVTTLLFQAGRWGIGLYLGKATQPSTFGAAASFAALLLWLYYSAQIFLLGAEFTAVLGGTRVDNKK